MKKTNRLGKVFGPVGSIAGYFVVIVGIVELFSSFKAILLIILGLFVGFTSYTTGIDFEKRRFRSAVALFGVLPLSIWNDIDNSMGLRINRCNKAWRTYSSSNRSFDISENNYRIELVDVHGRVLAGLQRFDGVDKAEEAIAFYSQRLQLPIVQHEKRVH